jgi:ureidoglycolate lyase
VESIAPQPLTAQLFAPFGDVIEARQSSAVMINQGTSTRFHDLAAVDMALRGICSPEHGHPAPPHPLPQDHETGSKCPG